MVKAYEHFSHAKQDIMPNTASCEECEKEHLPVVAVRMYLTCGHVGRRDSSVGKHATKHFENTGYPVMITMQESKWEWCYIHRVLLRNNFWHFNRKSYEKYFDCTTYS